MLLPLSAPARPVPPTPPGGGFDLIGVYAAAHGITEVEAIERLTRLAGMGDPDDGTVRRNRDRDRP
jgi:hypothetical protein